jgi:hypothetical protein
VRFIYLDEAGTSANEPVAVVAGVIVNADQQWKVLEAHLGGVCANYIPEQDRKGFVFHATELFSGGKYFDRSRWPLAIRLEILRAILSVRARLGVSVSVGYSFKEEGKFKNESGYALVRHMMAYAACLAGCEAYLREFGADGEVAMVVAEDSPDVRRHIREAHSAIIDPKSDFPAFRELIPFRHIVDTVHFADKNQSALLQYADAFAFTLRRHFAGYSHTDQLVDAIKGPLISGTLEPGGTAGYQILASYPSDILAEGISSSFSVPSR